MEVAGKHRGVELAAVAVLVATLGCANSLQVSVYTGATTYEVSTRSSSEGAATSGGQSSIAASSEGSSASSAMNLPSSLVLGGSALLLGAAGGIITTVYQVNANAKARMQADEFRRLNPPQLQTPPPSSLPPPSDLPPPASEPPPPPPPEPQAARAPTLDAMVMARAWLLANELQLKQDLALGAGPAIDDLAGLAGIPADHREHFGRVLQRHRQDLLIDSELTPQQAAAVMSRVGELVLGDPLLRADGLRAAR